MKLKLTITITSEQVNDIMESALGSAGIIHWCDEVRIIEPKTAKKTPDYMSEALTTGNYLILHDVEEEKWHYLTLKKFMKGLKMYVEQGGTLEPTEIDGPSADTIVQVAIFGRGTYA